MSMSDLERFGMGEEPAEVSKGADESAAEGSDERPSFISQEGWDALPDEDRETIRRERQRSGDLKKNYQQLHASVARLEGKLEGITAAGPRGGNGHGKAPQTVSDYSEGELEAFLAKARKTRGEALSKPDDPTVVRDLGLLGDGALEDEVRIELAARKAEARTGKRVEEMEARGTAAARAQAFHKRLSAIVGPETMTEIVNGNGVMNADHPLVMAANERAGEMLAERQIDPKNSDAVFVVIERAFEEVVAAKRGRDGSGRESTRGRLEMLSGRSADPASRGRPSASAISTLLRQGKVPEAHEKSLLDYLTHGGEVDPAFRVRMPR